MTTETSLPQCRIHQISNNRYKITTEKGVFTREHANRIPGCYFSGKQKAWVFPVSEKNQKIFEIVFQDQKKLPHPGHNIAENSSHLIRIFKQYLYQRRYSPKTIETYVFMVKRFLIFWKKKEPSDITMRDIEYYNFEYILKKGYSASFQNQFINAIKKFYELIENKKIQLNEIERPRKSMHLPKVLSKEEVGLIINGVQNLKHKALLSLIYSTGMRRSEVLNLRINDIDSNRSIITIRNAKGNKDRIVGLSSKILILLRNYYRQYKPKEYLFEGPGGKQYSGSSIGHIFKNARKKAGIKILGGVHILRHSYATHLHEAGYDIRIIQELLGHKSSKTTEIYTHISTKSIKNVKSPFDDLDEKYK